MAWYGKGEERVKSYRLYQELERNYHAALTEMEAMKTALRIKDELIRRMAAEIAMVPNRVEYADHLHQIAADAWSKNVDGPPMPTRSGERTAAGLEGRPGAYSEVGELRELDATETPPRSVRKGRTG